jgi:sugar lactone lactonase YvrE
VKAGIPLPHHVALDRDESWLYFAESGSLIAFVASVSQTVRFIILPASARPATAAMKGLAEKPACILPLDIACDSRNDLYVCDSGSNRIRKIDRETGTITTVVGTGEHGFNGDGPALEVNLTWPAAIAFDADDVMYIADTQAHRIRRYDSRTGLVETIAGSWTAEDEAREQPLVARNLVVLSGDAIGIDFSDDNGWLMPVCSDGLSLSMYLDDGKSGLGGAVV